MLLSVGSSVRGSKDWETVKTEGEGQHQFGVGDVVRWKTQNVALRIKQVSVTGIVIAKRLHELVPLQSVYVRVEELEWLKPEDTIA